MKKKVILLTVLAAVATTVVLANSKKTVKAPSVSPELEKQAVAVTVRYFEALGKNDWRQLRKLSPSMDREAIRDARSLTFGDAKGGKLECCGTDMEAGDADRLVVLGAVPSGTVLRFSLRRSGSGFVVTSVSI
ncbi:MAG: hypothetical protein IJU70_12185 [Lentisphaeria bacterium]|nr:hypothetical protein [Lentisphaeria bacterium]